MEAAGVVEAELEAAAAAATEPLAAADPPAAAEPPAEAEPPVAATTIAAAAAAAEAERGLLRSQATPPTAVVRVRSECSEPEKRLEKGHLTLPAGDCLQEESYVLDFASALSCVCTLMNILLITLLILIISCPSLTVNFLFRNSLFSF